MDYFDAHLWSVVRATDSRVIIVATSPGPNGFVVGKFEGFAGGHIFLSEVPNPTSQKGLQKGTVNKEEGKEGKTGTAGKKGKQRKMSCKDSTQGRKATQDPYQETECAMEFAQENHNINREEVAKKKGNKTKWQGQGGHIRLWVHIPEDCESHWQDLLDRSSHPF